MSLPDYVADMRYRSDGGKAPLFKMSSVNRDKWAVRYFIYFNSRGGNSGVEAELKDGK